MSIKNLIDELNSIVEALEESVTDEVIERDNVVEQAGDDFFDLFAEHYNSLEDQEDKEEAVITLARSLAPLVSIVRELETEDRPLSTAMLRTADSNSVFS